MRELKSFDLCEGQFDTADRPALQKLCKKVRCKEDLCLCSLKQYLGMQDFQAREGQSQFF